MTLRTSLSEYSVPVDLRAHVTAEVQAPSGANSLLSFLETSPGVHEAQVTLSQTGITRIRVMASGKTFRGTQFTREQTVTGAVWTGGDTPPPSPGPSDSGKPASGDLCCLLNCLVESESGQRLLKKFELDPKEVKRCLEHCCEPERKAPEK